MMAKELCMTLLLGTSISLMTFELSHAAPIAATKTDGQSIDAQKANQVIQQIYAVLSAYQLDYDIDACIGGKEYALKPPTELGKEVFIGKLQKVVEQGKPLQFFLPSFPFKSPNTTDRCPSFLPDMAERKALEYLNNIMASLNEIYEGGAQLTLLADGEFFNDALGVPDTDVQAYEDALKKIGDDLPHLTILTLSDILKSKTPQETREMINAQYPLSNEELEVLVQKDPKQFQSELNKNKADLPKETLAQLEKLTKLTTKRNQQFRSFIKKYLSDKSFVRLTVHYTDNISEKFGIKLSKKSVTTPWFGVALLTKNAEWIFVPLSAIDPKTQDLKVNLINGVPCLYYHEK